MVFSPVVVEALQKGKLAVVPTDTLYGIVCSARDKEAVEKLYHIRGRDERKPCILLLGDISELEVFGVVVSDMNKKALNKHWPGKVSVVFDCPEEKWDYLHRGTGALAFRVPDDEKLRNLLHTTGPLLAPSANLEGQPSAHTIIEAKNYFGGQVAVYSDGGYLDSLPSTVARLHDGKWEVLRQGVATL